MRNYLGKRALREGSSANLLFLQGEFGRNSRNGAYPPSAYSTQSPGRVPYPYNLLPNNLGGYGSYGSKRAASARVYTLPLGGERTSYEDVTPLRPWACGQALQTPRPILTKSNGGWAHSPRAGAAALAYPALLISSQRGSPVITRS